MHMILIDKPFGLNLKKLRKACHLTQIEVVARMQLMGSSLERSALANIEAGRRNIKVSDLRYLKAIYDVDYDAFFDYAEEE